jgi:fluoride exporter
VRAAAVLDVLLVALGAAVGAPLRYVTDLVVQTRHDSVFPFGTLTVNVAGSLLLGFLTGGLVAGEVADGVGLAVGAGFCGSLTTYSTFGYETVRLAQEGSRLLAASNVLVTLVTGLAAATLGWGVAQAVWG